MTDTTNVAQNDVPPQRSAMMLRFHAPIHRRPVVDNEAFKGLNSLEDVQHWMETIHAPARDAPAGVLAITLCGSRRFRREFIEWNAQLTGLGYLVYSVGNAAAVNPLIEPGPIEKATLDAVHFAKIERSDAIVVINPKVNGEPYIGESTAREIAWAEKIGKPVYYSGDITGYEYTKPAPDFWAGYGNDQLEEKARWLQGVIDHVYRRCPAAMMERCSSIYMVDVHEEYGWTDKVDENAIAEDPETYPEGARFIASFQGDIGEAVLVIDRNSFDTDLNRQMVRWHLEVLTEQEKSEREAKWKADTAATLARITRDKVDLPPQADGADE